ncbi:PelA/Pel-15E family pectate lyase [Lewinella marina]|uniref:Pectate lyase n=1 Tax=Neolewinella marina TaxID=438751 RepID=A0A2G0CAT5_9BACT|nr:pectate lyase [Neolewinella marina]NJB85850.1 PelA/Pel-15E family pectate lyase [Neolewinella marina]PHK97089.1 pectate lyase [Neolewinella marina]
MHAGWSGNWSDHLPVGPRNGPTRFRRTTFLPVLLCLLVSGGLGAQAGSIEWRDALRQPAEWYAGPEAARIADNLLVYQHPIGGWPKNLDMAAALDQEAKERIRRQQATRDHDLGRPTIDNGATYTQLRYLARVYAAGGGERYREAFNKGIDYLLEAQYPNGGWPQYYPLRKGYYSHITFNDGAMIGALELLREVATGTYPFVDRRRVRAARAAVEKGVELILATQIEVDGQLTAWCAQYDPQTLEPTTARAYELVSLSGAESVGIVNFLMGIPEPTVAITRAVEGAVDWFERVQLSELRLIRQENPALPKGYDLIVGFDPEHATPLWARFYEIGTNYPMFVGRDGVVRYALSEIEYERRVGYRWLNDWATELLEKDYPAWRKAWN